MKNSQFIIGNSSAGIREDPYYGVPIINIGTRQNNRVVDADLINVDCEQKNIEGALGLIDAQKTIIKTTDFGKGDSAVRFLESIEIDAIWAINHQKQFRDI